MTLVYAVFIDVNGAAGGKVDGVVYVGVAGIGVCVGKACGYMVAVVGCCEAEPAVGVAV